MVESKFQFHYGSIKGFLDKIVFKIQPCFNSTMVRLKVNTPVTTTSTSQKFQFHYGSIKG